MGKELSEVKFTEMRGKRFDVTLVIEMLCEVCEEPMYAKKRVLRALHFIHERDFNNLLTRARIHDRVEVDTLHCKIFLYDHDFPGDVHQKCIAQL